MSHPLTEPFVLCPSLVPKGAPQELLESHSHMSPSLMMCCDRDHANIVPVAVSIVCRKKGFITHNLAFGQICLQAFMIRSVPPCSLSD